jgi:hypothetical protein
MSCARILCVTSPERLLRLCMNSLHLEEKTLRGSLLAIFRLMKFPQMSRLLNRSSLCLNAYLRSTNRPQGAREILEQDIRRISWNAKDTR